MTSTKRHGKNCPHRYAYRPASGAHWLERRREDLWDSIVQEDEELLVSEEKRAELRRRKERFSQHPSSGRTWEQVKQRARTQHD